MAIISFKAGEAISAGDAVYVNSSGFLYKAGVGSFEKASAVGISIDTSSVSQLTRVNSDAIYYSSSGLTPGEYYYLSPQIDGAYVTYPAWASGIENTAYPSVYLTIIGRAISTSGIGVEISRPIFIENPATPLLLSESGSISSIVSIIQEDGSTIKLEVA